MYVYILDEKNFEKIISENKVVIVGVYEENCLISMLFKAMISQLQKNVHQDILFCLIEKHAYKKVDHGGNQDISPQIILFKDTKKIKVIEGFQKYQKVCEQLAI